MVTLVCRRVQPENGGMLTGSMCATRWNIQRATVMIKVVMMSVHPSRLER